MPKTTRRRRPSPLAEAQAKAVRALEALWQNALDDALVFLFGDDRQAGMVLTQDEHDNESPVKPLPNRLHLRTLTTLALENRSLVIGKSRQMMVSWWALAYILWRVLHPGQRWLVVCRTFVPADALLERMWGIAERLPVPKTIGDRTIKLLHLGIALKRREGTIVLKFDGADRPDSVVTAAAQDSDVARSFTYSGILVDEAAFTTQLADLFAASKPTTMGGGQYIEVSSPNGRGPFAQHLSDDGRIPL